MKVKSHFGFKRPWGLVVFSLFISIQPVMGQSTNHCNNLGSYPASPALALCIMWGEISTFDYDSGPVGVPHNVFAAWNSIAYKTAKAIACRNFKGKGLNQSEVNCDCPPATFSPPKGEAWRSKNGMEDMIDEVDGEMDGMSNAEKEAYCDGNYHWYHDRNRNGTFTGYMNPGLKNKTKNREDNNPTAEGKRIIKWRDHSGNDIDALFAHDDDIDNRFN